MKALLSATWLLFVTHLPRLLRSRRTLLVLIVALIPAAIAWIVTSVALKRSPSPGAVATMGGWILLMQVVVPLTALVMGSAAVAEEVEDRTLTYLFTRPMPRAALLLGRWAAIAVVLTVILALATWLFLVAAGRARGEGPQLDAGVRWPLATAVLMGGLAYSAAAAALGAFVRYPIVIGLGYAFAVEGFLANLPGKNQMLTLQHHLRSWIMAQGSETWSRFEKFTTAGTVDARTAAFVLVGVVVVALAVGSWRLSRREFLLSA